MSNDLAILQLPGELLSVLHAQGAHGTAVYCEYIVDAAEKKDD